MQVWRHEVPVDDNWHQLPADQVLAVESQLTGTVNLWSYSTHEADREYRVYGTGHDLPDDPELRYEGTARDAYVRALVWHVFSRPVA